MADELAAKKAFYPGLFLICLSTMMLQILLTRIFSAAVCASVIGTMIALLVGISSAFWVGAAFYILAWIAFARSVRLQLVAGPPLLSRDGLD